MLPALLHLIEPGKPIPKIIRLALSLIGLATVVLIGCIDYLSGYQIHFSFFYLPAIIFCSWVGGKGIGVLVATFSGLTAMLADTLIDQTTAHSAFSYWNALSRSGVFFLVVYMTCKIRILFANQVLLNENLNASLIEIRRLSGLLPICSWCKKIRDDSGYWQQVEKYLSEHSEAEFTHGICPDCDITVRKMVAPDNPNSTSA